MKPTLFLLAAGMGSRYGGLKQLDELGPHGETIMDYSIYDAINAGFGKLVFVIRKDSRKPSAVSFFQNTRATFLANSCSRALMHCQRDSHVRLTVQSLGVQTTLY